MFVVPLKWLPYLLVFAGVGGIFIGEDVGLSVGLLVVGGIWLLLKRNSSANKSSGTGSTRPNIGTPNANNNLPKMTLQDSKQKSESTAVRYCPRCGQANPGDALFCSRDGERLI